MRAKCGSGKSNPLDAATLGKIVFARFLSMPLRTYGRFVAKTESLSHFQELLPWVEVGAIGQGILRPTNSSGPQSGPFADLGEVLVHGNRPEFVYSSESFVREYYFDETAIVRLRETHALTKEVVAVLHRLRLINSRNRLTCAVVQAVLDAQAEYFASGDPLTLVALPQASMARMLAERADLPMVADASRLSRLVRGLSFRLGDGKSRPLGTLFPNERLLHCHRIDNLIKKEKTLLIEGDLERPLSDSDITKWLSRQYNVSMSRRSVASIRHHLAIPDWRRRAGHEEYLMETHGFSSLLPMTRQTVYGSIPAHPGVYEIRSLTTQGVLEGDNILSGRTRVIYIGSTRNLRKRLTDHLRGGSGNGPLSRYLSGGEAKVRYRLVNADWRAFERRLYTAFTETFGTPPVCNRMRP